MFLRNNRSSSARIRHYGFLSNRKRGTLLPRVYDALEMKAREKPKTPGFVTLMKGFLGTDPYKCILCGSRLRFAGAGRHAGNGTAVGKAA